MGARKPPKRKRKKSILVSGGRGYIGERLIALLAHSDEIKTLVSLDLVAEGPEIPGVVYIQNDIRSPSIARIFSHYKIDTLIHLASATGPAHHCHTGFSDEAHSIDLRGSENLLSACQEAGVGQVVYLSSEAVYAYTPGSQFDSQKEFTENSPRQASSNLVFARHKQAIEEQLNEYGRKNGGGNILIFRPGIVLGSDTQNRLSDYFQKRHIPGLRGANTHFGFIWDEDLIACVKQGVIENRSGVYNLVSDHTLKLEEIARRQNHKVRHIPRRLFAFALKSLALLGLSDYTPAHLDFLRYRPRMSNRKLKEEFAYRPRLNSAEVFELFRRGAAQRENSKREQKSTTMNKDKKNHFQDKVVVITGAAGGIGAALAKRFARAGARLALIDRDFEGVKNMAQELEISGTSSLALECDLTDPDATGKIFAGIVQVMGGVDVLINNAGVTQIGNFTNTNLNVYRRVMDINFFGSVHCTMAAREALLKSRGLIIITSSIAGISPLPGRTGYCASKHALHGFFETLRLELKHRGVRVLMVCPGFTDTPLKDVSSPESSANEKRGKNAAKKLLTPDIVAEKIFQAARKNKKKLIISFQGHLASLLKRFTPGLHEWILIRKFSRPDA